MTEDADSTDTDPEPLTVQTVVDLLRSPRRRHTIRILADQSPDNPVALVDLAEAVARREIENEELDDLTHKSVYVSLYQTHLPKLEEYGVVTTELEESDDGHVFPRKHTQTLADILAHIDSQIADEEQE